MTIKDFFIANQTWIFAVAMLILCYFKYRDPKKFRASTTSCKYFLGYLMYATIGISVFLLIAAFPEPVSRSLSVSGGDGESSRFDFIAQIFDIWANYLPAFAAVAVIWVPTWLFDKVRERHERLLEIIRSLVNIPVEQGLLAQQLRSGEYRLYDEDPIANVYSDEVNGNGSLYAAIVRSLEDDDIDERDWIFERQHNMRSQWVRAASLVRRFEKAFPKQEYRAYASIFPNKKNEVLREFAELRKIVPPLIKRVRTYLDSLEGEYIRPGTLEEQQRIRERFGAEIKKIRYDKLNGFIESIHEHFAGMVLCCATTQARRRRIIAGFGFDAVHGFGGIAGPIALSFLLVFAVAAIIFPTFAPQQYFKPEAVFRIFASMFGAVVVALIIVGWTHSRSLGFNNRQANDGHAEWESSVIPTVKAFILGGLVGLGVDLVIRAWMPEHFLVNTGVCYKQPLALAPAVAAAILVFLMVQRFIPPFKKLRQWCLDAAILTVSMISALLAVMYIFVPMFNAPAICETGANLNLPPVYTVVAVSGFIGLLIGGTIPAWIRRNQELMDEVAIRDEDVDQGAMGPTR